MPIYEFECQKCNNFFEKFSKTQNDTEETKCPNCQSKEVKKLISKNTFIFKGSCWSFDKYKSHN
jgi:putative FmdB family regulatory protein